MAKITEIPFEIEDHTVDEVVEFYVRSRKEFATSDANYIESLIDALQFIKTHYQDKENEQS